MHTVMPVGEGRVFPLACLGLEKKGPGERHTWPKGGTFTPHMRSVPRIQYTLTARFASPGGVRIGEVGSFRLEKALPARGKLPLPTFSKLGGKRQWILWYRRSWKTSRPLTG